MSNPNEYPNNLYDVYEHRITGQRICYKSVTYQNKYVRREIRFRRKVKAAVEKINFNKFLTLTYENVGDLKNDIRKFFNRWNCYRRKLGHKSPISYIWKLEWGNRTQRPHYHALCRVPFTSNKRVRSMWGKGFVRLQGVTSQRKATSYVLKYISKRNDSGIQEYYKRDLSIRTFGTSRDISKTPRSDWMFHGVIAKAAIPNEIVIHNEFV